MKQRVLVTGASRGIGKEIAITFAKNGYDVAINCLSNEHLLLEVKKEIESYGVSCIASTWDVGNFFECKQAISQILSVWDSIDILINNAGISHIGLLQDMSEMEWNRILSVNLSSAFYCSKLCIPSMVKKNSGKIITISSVWGVSGASCEVAYSATKSGIHGFTKALAKELAPSNIQVNAIACGAIDTEMNQFLSKEEKESLMEEIPAGRFGTPLEVAHLTLQLAQNNHYVTGQIIQLDGGWI